jgi:uncharacterized membrane protein HdeD (DUF308 family)
MRGDRPSMGKPRGHAGPKPHLTATVTIANVPMKVRDLDVKDRDSAVPRESEERSREVTIRRRRNGTPTCLFSSDGRHAMDEMDTSLADMRRAVGNALAAHWRLFLFQGVVMVVLGVLAVCVPMAATLAVDIYVGWLLLISGVFGLVALISTHHVHAFVWSLITAALSIGVGVLLIMKPLEGALSLTLVLTAFFIMEGVFQTAVAIASRHVMNRTWGWMLLSGIADLVLAAVIIAGWPGTAIWALGLLVGINLLTSGIALVMASLHGRDMARTDVGAAAGTA